MPRKYLSLFRYQRLILSLLFQDSQGAGMRYTLRNSRIVSENAAEALSQEFHELQFSSIYNEADEFYSRLKSADGFHNFPESWNAGRNLCIFLFTYIRITQPKVIVETGIANGFTTLTILEALKYYEGELHSFDIESSASSIGSGHSNWTFHKLDYRNPKVSLRKQAKELPAIDLWLHDSDHSFLWQNFEIELAKKYLKKSGLFVMDDIDSSRAWNNNNDTFASSSVVFDKRKFFGFAKFK